MVIADALNLFQERKEKQIPLLPFLVWFDFERERERRVKAEGREDKRRI